VAVPIKISKDLNPRIVRAFIVNDDTFKTNVPPHHRKEKEE
jgi:hypothetical protein